MGGWLTSEVAILKDAMNRMPFFCADCGTTSASLRLDPSKPYFRVKVWHVPSCPVLRNTRSRRACDDMNRDILAMLGHFVSDYCDETVGGHSASTRLTTARKVSSRLGPSR